MPAVQGKRWSWTLNNYTPEELATLASLIDTPLVSFLVYGKEISPSGTPHLQGYIELSTKKTLTAVKGLLSSRAHVEKSQGSGASNLTYCSKDGDFQVFGQLMKQGKRTDLIEVKEAIDSGIPFDELWDNHFPAMCKYRKSFEAYLSRSRRVRTEPPKVYIYWGSTGTGKTRTAFELDPDSTWSHPGGSWFDGYRGQRVAIFDEFDGSDVSFALWKRLTDRYPIHVPVKGDFAAWYPEIIVFTSNYSPDRWWLGQSKPTGWMDQLNRRVTETREFQ